MKILRAADAALNRLEGWLLVLFLSAMILMAFLQVVLRNVFSGGIIWGDVLLRHLVLWIGFLGAALATSNDRHIGIDALTRFLSPRSKSLIRVLTHLFAAVVCFLLADAARTLLAFEIEAGRELFLGIPEWYSQLIIPAGFSLLMLHFLVRMITSLHEVFTGKKDS